MIKVALVLVSALHPPAETPKEQPQAQFSCAGIQAAVKVHGEEAVLAEARRRGIPEDVIQFIKRKCLEEK